MGLGLANAHPWNCKGVKPLVRLCTVAVLVVSLTACDRAGDITFVNETRETVAFYVQSDVQAALLGGDIVRAGSSIKTSVFPGDYRWRRVAATREDGQWVFDQTYTKNEFEKTGSRIVVSSLEPIAPPAGVRVLPNWNARDPVVPPVTFVNETQEKLHFYSKSDVAAALTSTISVSARSSLEWGKVPPNFAWLRVAATRADGEWVFDQTYGWDKLENAKRRIIVSSLQPIAPPANVRVVPSPDGPPPRLPSPVAKPESGPTQAPASERP